MSDPLNRVLSAYADDADTNQLLPMGEKSVQERQGAMYAPLPKPAADIEEVEHTSTVKVYYHPPTGAFVTIPADT